MKSFWSEGLEAPSFPRLTHDVKTDVLIIGGGIAGLLIAHRLTESGVDCVLAEGGRICGGVTGSTTAKITSQHGAIYQKLVRSIGKHKAALYLDANEKAIEKYKLLSKRIDCDLEECPSFLYSTNDRGTLEAEMRALESIGAKASFEQSAALPFDTVGAVKFSHQARINPLKLAYGIAVGLKIFENTKILRISDGVAYSADAKIYAKSIVVATHFPFINRHGSYFMKMYQSRSYVIAIEGAGQLDGIYKDASPDGFSLRGANGALLVGGGAHRTGELGGGYLPITNLIDKYYPTSREICRFATQDCITLDGIAYIGRYSMLTKGLYVATGFNKWGMSTSMVAADILTDEILGCENEYKAIFSPSRSMLHIGLAKNALKAAKGLLTPTAPRCTHMKCALSYNAGEHSWDCSCHGSRYTEDGKVIDNPAMKEQKKLKRSSRKNEA